MKKGKGRRGMAAVANLEMSDNAKEILEDIRNPDTTILDCRDMHLVNQRLLWW